MRPSRSSRRTAEGEATARNEQADADFLTVMAEEIFSSSDIGMWLWDIANDRMTCNSVAAAFFGVDKVHSLASLPLKAFHDVIHPDDRGRFKELTDLSVRSGSVFVLEYRTVPRPERTFWLLARGKFTADVNGRYTRGSGILMDITGLRQPDAELYGSGRAHDGGPAINAVAERALDLWTSAQTLDPVDFARLKPLLESLLFETGRQLAKTIDRDVEERPGVARLH